MITEQDLIDSGFKNYDDHGFQFDDNGMCYAYAIKDDDICIRISKWSGDQDDTPKNFLTTTNNIDKKGVSIKDFKGWATCFLLGFDAPEVIDGFDLSKMAGK